MGEISESIFHVHSSAHDHTSDIPLTGRRSACGRLSLIVKTQA